MGSRDTRVRERVSADKLGAVCSGHTWPTRRETMITTSMVFIFVVIAALFFLVADKIIGFTVKLLLGVS